MAVRGSAQGTQERSRAPRRGVALGHPWVEARVLPWEDPERLGELLLRLTPKLTAVALRFTRDEDAARDVLQNAFEKAVRYGRRFRGQARVSTWLHRIVTNEALLWLRREKRRARRLVHIEEVRRLRLVDPSPAPPDLASHRECTARLRAAVARLRPEEREVVEHCALGRSYAELGRSTGTHPGALKSRAFRARRRLAVMVDEV